MKSMDESFQDIKFVWCVLVFYDSFNEVELSLDKK